MVKYRTRGTRQLFLKPPISNTHFGIMYSAHESFMRWHTSLNLHLNCFNTEAKFLAERSTSMWSYSSRFLSWEIGKGKGDILHYTVLLSKSKENIVFLAQKKYFIHMMIEDHQQNQTLFATIIFQSNTWILKSLNTICWLKKEYFLVKKSIFSCKLQENYCGMNSKPSWKKKNIT